MTGCGKPSGDPVDTLKAYEDHILNGRYDSAYGLMTKSNQEKITKEKFVLWRQLYNFETGKVKSYSIEKVGEGVDKDIDGVKYKNYVQLNLVEIYSSYYLDNRESPSPYEMYVVNEDGKWKVHRSIDFNERLTANYSNLARMYLDGKGKEKNYNRAAGIAKEGLKIDKDNFDLNLVLSLAYIAQEDIPQAFQVLQRMAGNFSATISPSSQSAVLNNLGYCYSRQGNIGEAISMYQKSLKINPESEYAKNALRRYGYR